MNGVGSTASNTFNGAVHTNKTLAVLQYQIFIQTIYLKDTNIVLLKVEYLQYHQFFLLVGCF